MFKKIPLKLFQAKDIYISPFNDNAIKLYEKLKNNGLHVKGFIDSNAKGDNIYSPKEIKEYDYIIIAKTRYLSQIVTNFSTPKVIIESKTLEFYDELYNKDNYFIKKNYKSRTKYIHYDDQNKEDQWQLEVYLHALGLMKKYNLKSVADFGCGSAYKLITYLGEYKTYGLELPINLEFLKNKYPDRTWLDSSFNKNLDLNIDVLICSDVIEHLLNPNELLEYLQKISFKFLVLSTPDRSIMYPKESLFQNGLPQNPAHQREWNYKEFDQYISKYFKIIDHRITNFHQATQMMICTHQ